MKFMLTILAMNLFVLASPKVINGDDMGIYEDEDSFNDLEAGKDLDDDQDADELTREKRITCDLFSSNRACAVHCYSLGKSGGYCSGGTCYCRRDSLGSYFRRQINNYIRRRRRRGGW